jgi:glycosyltransferase involved in cell wall biosynthesis
MTLVESDSRKICLVVPCYNEFRRWDDSYWQKLSLIENLDLVFVNDGSTDGTLELIMGVTSRFNYSLVNLEVNAGKAEAVRHGFLATSESSSFGIGFLDADCAFSVEEVTRQLNTFLDRNGNDEADVSVWSSRVQLAGRHIQRSSSRHYLARILLTILASRLNFKIYDPQSGLKIYPNSPKVRDCFSKKFNTRWFVDLEIYLRYFEINGEYMSVWEEPVNSWKDVPGSKIVSKEYLGIFREILKLLR